MEKKIVAGSAKSSKYTRMKDTTSVVGFNGLIFGKPGVGKTTFCTSLQGSKYGKNVLLHDVDTGRESVLGVSDASWYSPSTWQELRSELDHFIATKDNPEFHTHVFDSLSSIYYDLLMPKVTGGKPPEWSHYRVAGDLLSKFVRDAKSLADYGINTIFTGHVLEDKDGDNVTVRLGLPPSIRNEVLLWVNHIGYLTRVRDRQDPEAREIHFAPQRNVEGMKIRQDKNNPSVPAVIRNPSMSDILNSLQERGN